MTTRKISIISPIMAHKIQVFTSTEETRYYLNGFVIEKHPTEGAYLVATDGHRLGVFHDAAAVVAEGTRDVIKLSKDFLKACRAKTSIPFFVYIDHESQTAYLAADYRDKDGAGELPADLSKLPCCETVQLKCIIDGTFPDWARVCPTEFPDTIGKIAGFNAKYLADFNAISDKPAQGVAVTVHSHDPSYPAWVLVSGHPEFVGVVMPIRGGAPAKLPDWLFPEKAKAKAPAAPAEAKAQAAE